MLSLKRILFGSPLPSWRATAEQLPVLLALPVLASDALSSVAYSGEEILKIAGGYAVGTPLLLYVTAPIILLLAVVVTSYRQTIHAYPSGGGAYTVAKENLGTTWGLVAGAALGIGYTLTVAVSIAAGIDAIISAYPHLIHHRIHLGFGAIALIMIANLRGVRESGMIFAIPTYAFLLCAFALVVLGAYRLESGELQVVEQSQSLAPMQSISFLVILRAFSGGCTIMTGTEAISNAVPAFREPKTRNATLTLTLMGIILSALFAGTNYLVWKTGAMPSESETVISRIALATFGRSSLYLVMQFATSAILILAANTAYAGFPWLASVMARDRFVPRQLYNVGDRLVFSNGILLLSVLAFLLLLTFKGDTHRLIPLYGVGVFLSFTLSQAGMAVRFRRLRPAGWRRSASISALGASVTGVVTLVVGYTRFTEGAWIVIVLLVVLVAVLNKIHSHYIELGNQLRLRPEDKLQPMPSTVLVLTPSLHRGVLPALKFAKGLSADVRAVHISVDPVDTELLVERWDRWASSIPLVILESQYRSLIGPLLEYIEKVKREREDDIITVVIPEFVPAKWWHKILHNQSGLILKFVLLFRRDVITANVRYYLDK